MRRYFPWVGLLARLILGGTMVAAGYLKIDELDKSQMAVRSFELLPIGLANFLGIFLPFFELAVGLLLIVGAATRVSAALIGLLMIAFIIGIIQAWARGLSIDCGCFGGGGPVEPGTANYTTPLLRDFGLLALAIYLFYLPQSKFALDRHSSSSESTGE